MCSFATKSSKYSSKVIYNFTAKFKKYVHPNNLKATKTLKGYSYLSNVFFLNQGAFTYDVRCFWGIFDLPI